MEPLCWTFTLWSLSTNFFFCQALRTDDVLIGRITNSRRHDSRGKENALQLPNRSYAGQLRPRSGTDTWSSVIYSTEDGTTELLAAYDHHGPEHTNDMATSNNSATPSLIRQTAQRIRHIATCEISDKVQDKVAQALLDYYSSIAAGLKSPWAQSLSTYAARRCGEAEARSWALGEKVGVETAALTNAALAHR